MSEVLPMSVDQHFNYLSIDPSRALVWYDAHIVVEEGAVRDFYL